MENIIVTTVPLVLVSLLILLVVRLLRNGKLWKEQ